MLQEKCFLCWHQSVPLWSSLRNERAQCKVALRTYKLLYPVDEFIMSKDDHNTVWEILIVFCSVIILYTQYVYGGPGYRRRYSDILQAGRSEDWIQVWARFSAPVQASLGAHSPSYRIGTGSFLGVEWPGHGIDYPPPSSAKGKERVELYYSTSGLSWPVVAWTWYVYDLFLILLSFLHFL
jgi:hypothetical protein